MRQFESASTRKGISGMRLSHTLGRISTVFDDPNLVASAGLVPVMGLAQEAGLEELARQHLSVPGDKGANAGLKVASLVAGMVAGADSIDDMALLRHGGMGRLFAAIYAPSTLGSFLRAFAFGHVRQLDAVASRFLLALASLTRLGTTKPTVPADAERRGFAFVDVDDTVIEVHGHHKQGAGFGYTKVRGLNALLATATTSEAAPVIVAQRLRRGACSSPRGGKRLVADAVTTMKAAVARDATRTSPRSFRLRLMLSPFRSNDARRAPLSLDRWTTGIARAGPLVNKVCLLGERAQRRADGG